MTRYAAKTDANHSAIRDTLRAVPGMKVFDTAAYSGFGADLIAAFQGGPLYLLEVKATPKKPLTDSEQRAKALWGEYWRRVETVDDALAVFGIETEGAPF